MAQEIKPMIMTITGAISPEKGSIPLVLMHEHLYHAMDQSRRSLFASESPISIDLSTLANYYGNPCLSSTNFQLTSTDLLYRELEKLPPNTIVVDTTSIEDHRSPKKLLEIGKRIQQTKGIQIIASASLNLSILKEGTKYGQSAEIVLAKDLERQLRFGMDNESTCAGVIGPIVLPQQREYLSAAVQAHRETNACIFISYVEGWNKLDSMFHLVKSLISASACSTGSADATRIVLCHADLACHALTASDLLSLLSLGIVLSFDMIGLQRTARRACIHDNREPPADKVIAEMTSALITYENGVYRDQIILSHGIHMKTQLQCYGGGGFTHVLESFQDRLMNDHGLSELQLKHLFITTPLRLLTWYTPPPKQEIPKDYIPCSICNAPFEPIEGTYFSKYTFVYCSTKCLRKHSKMKFAPLNNESSHD